MRRSAYPLESLVASDTFVDDNEARRNFLGNLLLETHP